MKKWLTIFGLLFSFNCVFAQPCIKFYNYENGTWKIYKPNDKIFLILKNNCREQQFKIFSISDSGFESTTNRFICKPSATAVLQYIKSGYNLANKKNEQDRITRTDV